MQTWLKRIEGLHPVGIDMGLTRVAAVAQRMAIKFACPVITVGGTNGKGSTCAMLESIYGAAGYKVALHTSPHLWRFAERARFCQQMADNDALIAAFEQIEAARGDITLTYFEFTLLAILWWFMQQAPDVVILEVGLGGRLDAVNVIDADVSIVTSIDLDHTQYLGPTREHIGWEKAHIFRANRPAICADPVPPQRLIDYAEEIGADLWLFGRDFNYSGDRQQWNFAARGHKRHALPYPALRGANQLLNASAALAAIHALSDRLPVAQGAVRTGLLTVELPGRFQVLPGRPSVILDVAHNPQAAGVLAQNLDGIGFSPVTVAVFGAMADKDIAGVVARLMDRIDHWLLTDLPTPRAASAMQLQEILAQTGIQAGANRHVECFSDPASALAKARELTGENDRIVVFGSFYTVAGAMP